MSDIKQGKVVSIVGKSSAGVLVTTSKRHPIYKKKYEVSKKFIIHDAKSEAALGDIVEIMPIRPVSKTKSWGLKGIVEKAPEGAVIAEELEETLKTVSSGQKEADEKETKKAEEAAKVKAEVETKEEVAEEPEAEETEEESK